MPGQQSLTVADLNKFEAEVAQAQNSQGASVAQAQYASALSGGIAAGDTATPYSPVSTYANTPAYQLNPTTSPSAFGITDPTATIFTGYANASPMQIGQIIGALADKFHINPHSQNVMGAVLAHIESVLKLPSAPAPKWGHTANADLAPMPGVAADDPRLQQILSRLGAEPNSSTPGGAWGTIAQHFGVSPIKNGAKQMVPIAQALNGVASWSTPQIQQLQGLLYDAGLMPASTTPDAKKAAITGNWDVPTTQALGQLMQITAEANKAGQDVKWTDVLNSMVQNRGKGLLALYPQTHPAVTVATQEQMTQPAISAFENRLGRAPTAAELQGLTSSFDAQQTAHAADVTPGSVLFPDGSNIQQIPGAPTALQAAENYAMSNDPIGYQGHQFANAYALFLNALVPGKLPGVDPNITSAARPL